MEVADAERAAGYRNASLANFLKASRNLHHDVADVLKVYFRQFGAQDQVHHAHVRHYDASGDFAYRVGLPGKSGAGGGIVVIAPYRGAIADWSPRLNEAGNSNAGTLALEHIARETGWSGF